MRCVIVLSGFMSRDDFDTLPVQPLMFYDDINALPNIITTINQT